MIRGSGRRGDGCSFKQGGTQNDQRHRVLVDDSAPPRGAALCCAGGAVRVRRPAWGKNGIKIFSLSEDHGVDVGVAAGSMLG